MALATDALSAGQPMGIPGTSNLRSTGGYATPTGVVREGALFRSDALHKLDTAGITRLDELGVVRVLDLRDPVELELEPSAVVGTAIDVVHHPVFGEDGLVGIGSFHLDEVYRFVIEYRAESLAGAMRLIAHAPDGGVLVHCTAGKDRTGLVIATALCAVGVSREQIIADYETSESNLAGERAERILAAARERFGELDEGAIELMVRSPARAIGYALDIMDERYGGVEGMLLANGFNEQDVETLRTRLVD